MKRQCGNEHEQEVQCKACAKHWLYDGREGCARARMGIIVALDEGISAREVDGGVVLKRQRRGASEGARVAEGDDELGAVVGAPREGQPAAARRTATPAPRPGTPAAARRVGNFRTQDGPE